MFYKKVDYTALRATAEALVTVASRIHLEAAKASVFVEWAKGFVAHTRFLQPCPVVGAVTAQAVLDYFVDFGRFKDFVDYFSLDHRALVVKCLGLHEKPYRACARGACMCRVNCSPAPPKRASS
jgi:hypothetical protein